MGKVVRVAEETKKRNVMGVGVVAKAGQPDHSQQKQEQQQQRGQQQPQP